jgi:hypothetical protein
MQACPIRRGPSSSSLSADPQGGRQAPLTPERRSKHGEDGSDFENRLAELAANVAEIRAALARANDTEAEMRTRATVAEARLEAERVGARELIAQLRSELAEARRPWWRRWG